MVEGNGKMELRKFKRVKVGNTMLVQGSDNVRWVGERRVW